MNGVLQKTSIKKGHSSSVGVGHSVYGELQRMVGFPDKGEVMEVVDLSEVQVGDMLLIYASPFDFIKCSPISEIIKVTDKELEIKTKTSEYTFSEIT